MEIRPSDILKPTNKVIKYDGYETALVASEGPITVAKFPMTKQFNYDSVFVGKMILQPGVGDQPIVYGFVGNEITFLAISIDYNYTQSQNSSTYPNTTSYGSSKSSCSGNLTYGGNCNNSYSTGNAQYPNCNNNSNAGSGNYIEYYFEDEPLIRRPITDMFMTTGNEYHRIPQMYVYNPTPYPILLTIMAANIGSNTISTNINPTDTTFSNLAYTQILSDQTIYNVGYTGSTQFEIYDGANNLILAIPYLKIEVVEVVGNIMTISTDSDQVITLQFLSEFNARQAHSRMSWALEYYQRRYLTADYPGVDDVGPVINFYSAPIIHYSGVTLCKNRLREIFIESITDDRDGPINIYNANVVIQKQNSVLQYEKITEPGTYWIYFSIKDIAGNETSATKTLYMYESAPRIAWNPSSSASTMYIDDSFYYKVAYNANIINESDIRNYYIYKVEDYVDTISNSAVTVVISSGTTISGITSSGITMVGNFTIKFSVTNGGGLTDTEYKNLNIFTYPTFAVPVVYFNSGFTDPIIYSGLTSGMTQANLLSVMVSAITFNEYDPYNTIDSIVITGITFPTQSSMFPSTTTFKLTNFSGVENIGQVDRTKIIYII